jgi:hypothetical protein
MLSLRLPMRLFRALSLLIVATLVVVGGACVLNPQPQPPDTADGAGGDAGVTLGADAGTMDSGKGGVDSGDGGPTGADAGDAGDAADASLDAPEEGG